MGSKIGTAEPAAILRPTLHRREGKLGGGGGEQNTTQKPKTQHQAANNYIEGQCTNKHTDIWKVAE